MFDLLLTGGRVVTSEGIVRADVGVANGVIASINPRGADTSAAESIYISGKLLVSGSVDAHAHLTPIFGNSINSISRYHIMKEATSASAIFPAMTSVIA